MKCCSFHAFGIRCSDERIFSVKAFPAEDLVPRRCEMNRNAVPFVGFILLLLLSSLPVTAQDDATVSSAAGDLYVISAKAGGVNYVEGTATVLRADGTSGILVKGEDLDAGDRIETSVGARVEILLNPGSYARLDENSKFELSTTSLDDLRLKVLKGSAIFEVYASDDFKVTVNTPQSELYLVKTGVYRVDVFNDGTARLEVWKGKAETEGDADSSLKKGRSAVLDGGDVEVAKFDRGEKDEFERWSKDRAELIAKANKKFQTKDLSRSLLRGFQNDIWNCYSSVGLWVYSRRYGTYSFLPFGYGWRSAYGYGLRTSTGICYDPDYYYYQRYPGIYKGGRPRSADQPTGQQPTTNIPQENIERGNRAVTPPFQRVQRTGGVVVGRPGPPAASGGFPPMGGGERRSTSTTPPPPPPASKDGSSSKGKDN